MFVLFGNGRKVIGRATTIQPTNIGQTLNNVISAGYIVLEAAMVLGVGGVRKRGFLSPRCWTTRWISRKK